MIPTGQRHIRTYSERHVSPFADRSGSTIGATTATATATGAARPHASRTADQRVIAVITPEGNCRDQVR
jgi:hypothetical protein